MRGDRGCLRRYQTRFFLDEVLLVEFDSAYASEAFHGSGSFFGHRAEKERAKERHEGKKRKKERTNERRGSTNEEGRYAEEIRSELTLQSTPDRMQMGMTLAVPGVLQLDVSAGVASRENGKQKRQRRKNK